MEKDNKLLKRINKNSLEILLYFIQNIIYDTHPSSIEYFLKELLESSLLRSFKDRRSSNTFQRFRTRRRFREKRIYENLNKEREIYENFRAFFLLREKNLRISNFKDFHIFFKNLDDKIDNFSKTVKEVIDTFFELEGEKEYSNKNNYILFKACTYWYMNSKIIPRFSNIKYIDNKKIQEFKRMLQYAFILFFRLYEQSSLDFQNLNAIEVDLEVDYLIQDINNIIRFVREIK